MSYLILGQNLHDTADNAKRYFANHYGALHFECEREVAEDLPLKPTWQATLGAGYRLCVDVRETPFSPSLSQFVTECATRALPIKLWVAIPQGSAGPTFNAELKQARVQGVGVVQIGENGAGHDFHRPVALSLFALRKTDLNLVPRSKRESLKTAESTFLDGTPDQGCQAVCQELESLTRQFSEYTYTNGWWRQSAGSHAVKAEFFQRDPWARVLEQLETRVEPNKVRAKVETFTKQAIVRVRAVTDWRNQLSHKPKTLKQLAARDARLRTMFESTRDLLIEWYGIAKPLKLL